MTPRFDHATTPPGRKTPRIRGRIVQFIFEVAARKRTFTWQDLKPLPHQRALDNLRSLARQGQVVVVARGIPGRPTGCPAIFAAARSPRQTL